MCQHGLFRHLNDGYFYTGFTDLQDGLQPQGILQNVHNLFLCEHKMRTLLGCR